MEKLNDKSALPAENVTVAGNDGLPNPQPFLERQEAPLKNPFCPYYGECLNFAVKSLWPQFTCSECGFQNLHLHVNPDVYEVKAYYNLLARIFVDK
jgi:hypothetical protein